MQSDADFTATLTAYLAQFSEGQEPFLFSETTMAQSIAKKLWPCPATRIVHAKTTMAFLRFPAENCSRWPGYAFPHGPTRIQPREPGSLRRAVSRL